MNSTVTYKCPNCGAGLLFNAETQEFSCEFCLSSFREDVLLSTEAAKAAEEKERTDREYSEQINEYHCASCGAEVITDKSTAADFCAYCHNPIVMAERVSGVHKPDKIIPFKFNKDEAKSIFLKYAKKKWFLPRDYFAPEQSDKISGIYYPFWVVDADTGATLSARGSRVRSWRQGNYRYTETSYFSVKRGGAIHFEDITSSAISTEDKSMLEGILPYPIDEYVDFSIPYLQGYTAKKRDISREDITPDVRTKMNDYGERLLMDTVVGYTAVDSKNTDIKINSSHFEYALAPIWILTYKRKNKSYTYAMNGNTGKIYGELPVSIPKLSLLGAAVALFFGILSFIIGWGMF